MRPQEYGIAVNSDAVVRTVYYKYLHPKEVYVSTGVVNRELNRAAGKGKGKDATGKETSEEQLAFVYPYGSTMNVQKPAIPILASGYISYPLNRPVAARRPPLPPPCDSHTFRGAWHGARTRTDVLMRTPACARAVATARVVCLKCARVGAGHDVRGEGQRPALRHGFDAHV